MTTMSIINRAQREMSRVFGSAEVSTDVDDGSAVIARVKGWPDPVVYRTGLLLETLGRYEDGHGLTEEGDREVCSALEDAGAFVSMGV